MVLLHVFRYDLPWQPALDARGSARRISCKGAHVPDIHARPEPLEAGLPLRHAAARDEAGSLLHDRDGLPRLYRLGEGRAPPAIRYGPRGRYVGGPSRTGRTSTVPTRATASRAAIAIASSGAVTSMSM